MNYPTPTLRTSSVPKKLLSEIWSAFSIRQFTQLIPGLEELLIRKSIILQCPFKYYGIPDIWFISLWTISDNFVYLFLTEWDVIRFMFARPLESLSNWSFISIPDINLFFLLIVHVLAMVGYWRNFSSEPIISKPIFIIY